MELSEQATQELAEGSTAISRVAGLEARVAELEAQGRRLEAERVKAEKDLRKERCSKESSRCMLSPFCDVLPLTCVLFRGRGLHLGQRGAAEAPGGG